jgi:hypothetical protein
MRVMLRPGVWFSAVGLVLASLVTPAVASPSTTAGRDVGLVYDNGTRAVVGANAALQAPRDQLRRSLLAGNDLSPVLQAVRDDAVSTLAGDDAEPEATPSADFLEPAGDFDGDGLRDVLGSALLYDEDTGEYVVRLNGRAGVDGMHLWSRTVDSSYAGAVPVPVGRNEGGVLLLREGSSEDASGATTSWMDLEMIDGDGETVWSRRFTSTVEQTPVGTVGRGVFFGGAFFDAVADGATDILIGTYDFVFTQGVFRERLQALVINGADGSTAGVGTEVHVDDATSGSFPSLLTVPDVTADGLDDFAFVLELPAGRGEVSLRGGLDGVERWRARGVPIDGFPYLFEVGDVTGDGVQELALYSDGDGRREASTSLIDGLLGVVYWSRAEVFPFVLGDVDRDGLADVGAQSFIIEDERFGARYEVLDRSGTAKRSVEHVIPASDEPFLYGEVQLAGDVARDGIADTFLTLYSYDYDTGDDTFLDGVVDGADSALRWTGALREGLENVTAVAASIDGAGDDVIGVDRGMYGPPTITALDGATGVQVWTTEVETRTFISLTDTADLDGDGKAEVFIADQSGSNAGLILQGADGTVLWAR